MHIYAERERKKKVKNTFDTFQFVLPAITGNSWPLPALFSELWHGAIPHLLFAPWLFQKKIHLGNRDISAIWRMSSLLYYIASRLGKLRTAVSGRIRNNACSSSLSPPTEL